MQKFLDFFFKVLYNPPEHNRKTKNMDKSFYRHNENSATIAFNNISRENFEKLDIDPELRNRILVELADWMDCNVHIEDGKVTHITSSSWLSNEKPSWGVRVMMHFERNKILNTKERVEEAKKLAKEYWSKEENRNW